MSISNIPFGSMIWKALTLASRSNEKRQFSHTIAGRREGSFKFLQEKYKTEKEEIALRN